jgi:hypothetical protein
MKDWSTYVPSIISQTPERRCGSWKKNIDFLRLDGSTKSIERGNLIDQFSSRIETKLFLISSKAGGMGINLVSANRVILFDSHFNPAIDAQAIFRSYRYGQKKPVFIYRLLTQGTLEEKVYSRSVNKTSLFLRAVEQKNLERIFTEAELENMLENDSWVQCNKCAKWRMLHPKADDENLPDEWNCEMNTYDPDRSTCEAPEDRNPGFISKLSDPDEDKYDEKLELTKRDVILGHLLKCFSNEMDCFREKNKESLKRQKSSKSLISKYYFHDSLFRDQCDIVPL